MKLSFLGNGDSFNYLNGNNSAFFKKDDCLFILDMGQSIFAKILYLNLLDEVKHVVIFITHLHLDHIGSLGEAVTYFKVFNKDISFRIIYPDALSLLGCMELYPLEKSDIITSKKGEIFGINYLIENARHIDNSYCYFLDDGVSKIYYSGDNSELNKTALDLLSNGKLDYFYQDVSVSSSSFHIGYDDIKKSIERNLRPNVVLMHLPSSFDILKASKDGFGLSSLYK